MNTKIIVAIVTLTATLFFGAAFVGPINASPYTGYGPESPEMNLYYYADETSLYTAFKAGSIDLSLWEATRAQYYDAITDPNIILVPVARLDMRAFSLNNNETIAALPGVRIPTSYSIFRKSLWCMVDRDYYTQVVCGGFATPVYVMVSAPSTSWVNVTAQNYVMTQYAYNILTASLYLDNSTLVGGNGNGFAQRVGDTNPYYNPAVPGSAQYWRGYPAGHSRAGQRIDPVVFSARVDDGLRFAASSHLRDRMLMSGIPVNFIAEPSSSAFLRVMTARNYMIYSAGWTTGRFATYQWGWYHTSRWQPGGSNYHIAPTAPEYTRISSNPGAYPNARPEDIFDTDYYGSRVWYPPTFNDAIYAAKMQQGLATQKYATFIPLWCGRAFFYYRNLYGVTNQDGTGPENTYTFQEMRRADGGTPIRVGHKSPPTQVNQIYSSWVWDVTTMGQTQDAYYNLNPFNLLNEQPGLAQDWTNAPGGPMGSPGNWTDPDDGQLKSKMRYWFLDDPSDGSPSSDSPTTHSGDADPEWVSQGLPAAGGGTVLADFADQWLGGGYEFNCWYYDSEIAGWGWGGFKDIKHVVSNPAGHYADVYFDTFSYWSYTWPWFRNLYCDEPASYDHTVLGWKTAPLSTQQTRSFTGPISRGSYLNTPLRAEGSPVEIISVTIDGVPATKATAPYLYNGAIGSAGGDYSIVGNSVDGGRIRIFKDVTTSLTVTYWARGAPAGYWPGGLNFQTTLIGTGQYYMTSFLSGAGGYATYKANNHNYMQNAPNGEVDWYWYWIAGTQPRDGYYRTDLYDLAAVAGADGSSGNAIPTPAWNPGCDIAPPLAQVNIQDFVAASVNYGKTYSSPYPNPPP